VRDIPFLVGKAMRSEEKPEKKRKAKKRKSLKMV
jgi:hypothetical protein